MQFSSQALLTFASYPSQSTKATMSDNSPKGPRNPGPRKPFERPARAKKPAGHAGKPFSKPGDARPSGSRPGGPKPFGKKPGQPGDKPFAARKSSCRQTVSRAGSPGAAHRWPTMSAKPSVSPSGWPARGVASRRDAEENDRRRPGEAQRPCAEFAGNQRILCRPDRGR